MTRLWPDGIPVNVEHGTDGTPVSFIWDGKTHRVTEVPNQWWVDADWWSGRKWRAYYKLTTDTGMLVEVYRNLLTEKWFLQRLYD